MAASAPQSQSLPLSAEEEALKRNTDCVYFLASPLTCKKGNECEYRHSDIARVNPRDCYFWPQGNCLNPKCGFRHPPLEGLLGTQAPTSTVPSAPVSVSQTVMAPTHVSNAPLTKPGVPSCVFFQKGYCMKGDWCPFLHAPNSFNTKLSPMPTTAPPAEPAAEKKASIGLKNPLQEKKNMPANVTIKSVKDSSGAKPTFEEERAPPRNEFTINRKAQHNAPVSNGNLVNWPGRVQQYRHLDEPEPELELENMNSKDAEEFSREPSPGFDVLVDDDIRDTDYYPSEDRYGMPMEHETRNEYDIGLSTDYNSLANNDEKYQGPIGYDSHQHRKGQYGWEQHRYSPERRLGGGPYFERRPYSRDDARPDVVGPADALDLRHHLSKQKKPNGLRSVISNENSRDMRSADRRSYREGGHNSSREKSFSNRLRGRISLPGRSPSPSNNRDNMFRGRLSPVRVKMSAHQGRAHDRIRGNVEGFHNNNDGKSSRGLRSRIDEGAVGFSGPKSLAELKNRKNGEPSRRDSNDQQQSQGKRKLVHEESGNGFPFEGPKPLQEILKRKRGEKIQNSSGNEDKIIAEGKDHETNNETVTPIGKNVEVNTDDGNHNNQHDNNNNSKQDGGDGVRDDQEGEGAYEQQRCGVESDYEQVVGEDYDMYDGENGEADEDDDDDFAKKMGVMYS